MKSPLEVIPMKVENGIPDQDSVLELLNSAYDGWGDKSHFDWRYACYPEYSEEEHTYHISDGDTVAAFRRATYKELEFEGVIVPFYILGDTAVASEYRGQGLYSNLHEVTTNYCADKKEVPFVMTFNRKGNVTFAANRDRGWKYFTLPLYLRIFDPTAVFPHYADLALENKPRIRRVLSILGGRMAVTTSSGEISLGEIVKPDRSRDKQLTMSVSISDRAVSKLVEQISNDQSISGLLKRSLGLLRDREVSLFGAPKDEYDQKSSSRSAVTGERVDALSDAQLEEIIELYDHYDVTMRRDRVDIEHMLEHPHLFDILVAKRHGRIVGFAPLAFHSGSSIREARVLDLVYADEVIFDPLLETVEQSARENGADLLAVLSDFDPGEYWISIDRQVLMWDQLHASEVNEDKLEARGMHVGFFDIA